MIKVRLKQIIEDKNMSVYALSKKTNISQYNLANLIKGNTTAIKFDTLEKLCTELNVGITDILEIIKD